MPASSGSYHAYPVLKVSRTALGHDVDIHRWHHARDIEHAAVNSRARRSINVQGCFVESLATHDRSRMCLHVTHDVTVHPWSRLRQAQCRTVVATLERNMRSVRADEDATCIPSSIGRKIWGNISRRSARFLLPWP